MKKNIIIICVLIAVVGVTIGVIYGAAHIKNETIEKERQSGVSEELIYANLFSFSSYTHMSDIVFDFLEDPSIIDRVEFCEERPADFEYGQAKDGVAILFPSEATQKRLDRLNHVIKIDNMDIAKYGFNSAITMYDVVHRRAEVRTLIAALSYESHMDVFSSKFL